MLQSEKPSHKLVISPPSMGGWHIIDHISRPGSRLFSEYYYKPMQDGWNEEARRIGVIIRVKIREAGGFMYYQPKMAVPKEITLAERQIRGYWKSRRFLKDLEIWDKEVKTKSIKELSKLQNVRLGDLSNTELAHHLERCFEATKKNVKRHHRYTYTSFIPLGDFINQVSGWLKIQPSEILHSIEDGKIANLPIVSNELLNVLAKDIGVLRLLSIAEDHLEQAPQIFSDLALLENTIGEGIHNLMKQWGYRIVDGYDVTSETYAERPDLLLRSLKSAMDKRRSRTSLEIDNLIRNIPPEKSRLFDDLLNNALAMKRLRNERGLYTDLWAIGILRHTVLEIGKRLTEKGLIDKPDLALEASILEINQLLNKRKAVTSNELLERANYRNNHTINNAPPVLGVASGEPFNLAGVSPEMARTMSGLMLAIELAVNHQPPVTASDLQNKPDILTGIPASKGICEGFARVISSIDQIREIQRGDILVVYQSTAAFNAVFPLIGGIVSQYGGTLSHPAILAREQGIPCIVGCTDVMRKLKTGMHISVNGTSGVIKIMTDENVPRLQIQDLQCEYVGPMQGRNRDRALNHVTAVQKRLDLVKYFRQAPLAFKILEQHFQKTTPTDESLEKINRIWAGFGPWQGNFRTVLADWLERFHLEFHPCDACNLQCDGCTYYQDHQLSPSQSSFPFDHISNIFSTMKPRAITLVGGGEPALYRSQGMQLGDLISALGEGTFGIRPSIGLITNGTTLPKGNPGWHQYTEWIRFSLDAADPQVYKNFKGRDHFNKVVDNVFRVLIETKIPKVGVGYIYHPGNIAKAAELINLFAKRIQEICPEHLHRFNIQFRPWRSPIGQPSIRDRIISKKDIAAAEEFTLALVQSDPFLEKFIRQNTNLAINLLCGGAREKVEHFSECFVGLAKAVIRADGSVYPCFRVAAERNPNFLAGNILHDSSESIALKSLYVITKSVQTICVPEFDKCLFCVFNNIIESNLNQTFDLPPAIAGDYFF